MLSPPRGRWRAQSALAVCGVCVLCGATVTSTHRVMGSEQGPKAYVYVVFSSSRSLVSGYAAEILKSKFRHFVTTEMSADLLKAI